MRGMHISKARYRGWNNGYWILDAGYWILDAGCWMGRWKDGSKVVG
jgi:hypothetical protein